MLARALLATLTMWTVGGARPQAAAAPPVGRARRAAQHSPENREPTTGHPGKSHGGQVGAAEASQLLIKAPLGLVANADGCVSF